tara:strand:+ start:8647 stop:8853 length:207 start_codon:yes stop_codon:yes gene_type:complete
VHAAKIMIPVLKGKRNDSVFEEWVDGVTREQGDGSWMLDAGSCTSTAFRQHFDSTSTALRQAQCSSSV